MSVQMVGELGERGTAGLDVGIRAGKTPLSALQQPAERDMLRLQPPQGVPEVRKEPREDREDTAVLDVMMRRDNLAVAVAPCLELPVMGRNAQVSDRGMCLTGGERAFSQAVQRPAGGAEVGRQVTVRGAEHGDLFQARGRGR